MSTSTPITSDEKQRLLAQKFTSPGYQNWRKVASVTPGGKPHFYVRFAPSCLDGGTKKQTIVWHRGECCWHFCADADRGGAPLRALRHHVSGAIERGEAEAIVGVPKGWSEITPD